MSKHTPGPWKVRGQYIVPTAKALKNRLILAEVTSLKKWDNAQRIVDCVNACEGINPAAIPEMLEALKGLAQEMKRPLLTDTGRLKIIEDAIAKAKVKS